MIEMYGILVGAPESWKEMRGLGTEGGEKGQRWRIHLAPPSGCLRTMPLDRGHFSGCRMCQGFPLPALTAGCRPGNPRSLWLQGPLL